MCLSQIHECILECTRICWFQIYFYLEVSGNTAISKLSLANEEHLKASPPEKKPTNRQKKPNKSENVRRQIENIEEKWKNVKNQFKLLKTYWLIQIADAINGQYIRKSFSSFIQSFEMRSCHTLCVRREQCLLRTWWACRTRSAHLSALHLFDSVLVATVSFVVLVKFSVYFISEK